MDKNSTCTIPLEEYIELRTFKIDIEKKLKSEKRYMWIESFSIGGNFRTIFKTENEAIKQVIEQKDFEIKQLKSLIEAYEKKKNKSWGFF